MKIFNDLKLRFEQQIWEKSPELAVIDSIIVSKKELVNIIKDDVIKELKNNKLGRKDNPTVEQILRLAIYKEIKKLNYNELEFHQFDSQTCKEFVMLDGRKPFSSSILQEYISKIQYKNLESIMIFINKIAFDLGYEDGEAIRIDSTKAETNIQHPTNNSLTYDCIKTASNIIEKLYEKHSDAWNKLELRRMEAKKVNYELNNVKIKDVKKNEIKEKRKEKMKSLFEAYLSKLKEIHNEVKEALKTDISKLSKRNQKTLLNLDRQIDIVYKNAYKFQIEGKKIAKEDKIFSIYEEHTDIISKGIREIVFGHKINLATGKSNMFLYCKVEKGNPSDTNLFEEPLKKIEEDYKEVKKHTKSVATDGGYASGDNLNFAKSKALVNIVFTKIVGSLKSVAESIDIENELNKWRGGIEGCISNLKRGFKLRRVTWRGWDLFNAKVFWSVIAYNIRVLTGHILETLKAI